jgi:hypothetical protein
MEFSREQALADPEAVNAAITAALGGPQLPIIDDAPSDLVNLPGGLVYSGKMIKTAIVRELNGSDEEALSRAIKSNNGFHFIDTLLSRGTVAIGDYPATPDILASMLLGDRDELLMAIRIATYGADFAMDEWTCPNCEAKTDLRFPLDAIDRVHLSDTSAEPTITVALKKNATALVRFPNGEDQKAISDPTWTTTERNSELLRRCVKSITQADGNVIHVAAFPSAISNMSIPDRRAISAAMYDQAPGPRFQEISFVHEECQKEVKLALSPVDMFRELILGL